jgi:hypothetical protein
MMYLDSALLDLTEWICRRFQVLTGRTNVWLAFQLTNLSIIVYFVWTGVYFWTIEGLPRIMLALFCGGVFYLLTQTVFKDAVEAHENNAYRRVTKGLRNPRRIRDAALRIAFLTLSVVTFFPLLFVYLNLHRFAIYLSFLSDTSILFSCSLIVLTTVVLYLLACDPLPPCAGRIKEWLGSLAVGPARAAREPLRFRIPRSASTIERVFSRSRPAPGSGRKLRAGG